MILWFMLLCFWLEPPSLFYFKSPDQWQRWKKRFDQYRLALGLSTEPQERRWVSTLYCMGEDAEETLTSTHISKDDRKQYSTVIEKFDTFFKVRKNVIIERARFNRCCQTEGESVEQFITTVYNLADNCEFGALTDELIRNRIIVGISDNALSERMQIVPDLMLEKAKRMVRQREDVQKQQEILQGGMQPTLFAVRRASTRPRKPTKYLPIGAPRQRSSDTNKQCSRCGKGPHIR